MTDNSARMVDEFVNFMETSSRVSPQGEVKRVNVPLPSAVPKVPSSGSEDHELPSIPSTILSDKQGEEEKARKIARQMFQEHMERQQREEDILEQRKRKRQEDKDLKRKVKARMSIITEQLKEVNSTNFQGNKELYELFNDLQGVSKDFSIDFTAPQLVVIGMQSDGKSTFVEALLGFQFNVVESNIGTRRPLVLMMFNNPSRKKPSCRFRREECSSSLEGVDDNDFEAHETPVALLSEEIRRRTDEIAGRGDGISESPIFLRVEYEACATLTIVDIPGLRTGGDPQLADKIKSIAVKALRNPNNTIVCIEQSTVEWANSQSRPLVRSIDPNFTRTVLVNTKFDNRIKELRNKETADNYLAGEGLPEGVLPFYVSLPVDRNLDFEEFQEEVQNCYIRDYKSLLDVNFEEEKFGEQIGFCKTKAYLERFLHRRYHESLRPTLQELKRVCNITKLEISELENSLQSQSISALRDQCFVFVQRFCNEITNLLQGSISADPDVHGDTLEEEIISSGAPWPNGYGMRHEDRDLKLFGAAQLNRLMREFEAVVKDCDIPSASENELACAMASCKPFLMSAESVEAALGRIVADKSKDIFAELIPVLLQRVLYVLKKLFSVAEEAWKKKKRSALDKASSAFTALSFSDMHRSLYIAYLQQLEKNCNRTIFEDFDAMVEFADCTSLSRLQLSESPALDQNMSGELMPDDVGPQTELFRVISFLFLNLMRQKVNCFLIRPMLNDMSIALQRQFNGMTDEKFEDLMQLGIRDKENRLERLRDQLSTVCAQRDRFCEAFDKISNKLA